MAPFRTRRRERRSTSDGYTDQIVAAFEAAAEGAAIDVARTAAVEASAGLIARAAAAATVNCANEAVAACITPTWLHRCLRDAVAAPAGHLSRIQVRGGAIELTPASTWSWYGNGASRRVLASFPEPDDSRTIVVPEAALVVFGWAPNRLQPWYRSNPASTARMSMRLAANMEHRLGQETGGNTGFLTVMPRARTRDSGEAFDARAAAIDELAGRTISVPPSGGYDPAGGQQGTQFDLMPKRVGANPPEALVQLQDQVYRQTLAAHGVPGDLAGGAGAAAATRESFRRFAFSTVLPLLRMLGEELTRKLEAEVSFRIDDLAAADVSGRTRGLKQLVEAGYDLPTAARIVGLEPPAAPTRTSTSSVSSNGSSAPQGVPA